ncbi:MAG: hypothetical protein WBO55_09110, partial [Rhizobiaceae bacterium]
YVTDVMEWECKMTNNGRFPADTLGKLSAQQECAGFTTRRFRRVQGYEFHLRTLMRRRKRPFPVNQPPS